MQKKFISSILFFTIIFSFNSFNATAKDVSDAAAARKTVMLWVKYQNEANAKGFKNIVIEKSAKKMNVNKTKKNLQKSRKKNGLISINKFFETSVDSNVAVVTVELESSKKSGVDRLDVLLVFENEFWKIGGYSDSDFEVKLIPARFKIDHYFKSNSLNMNTVLAGVFQSFGRPPFEYFSISIN